MGIWEIYENDIKEFLLASIPGTYHILILCVLAAGPPGLNPKFVLFVIRWDLVDGPLGPALL